MLNCIKKFKKFIIVMGILMLIIGTLYFLNNRNIKEIPERADLVLNIIDFIKDIKVKHG